MLNTPLHRMIKSVRIKLEIFTGRPPSRIHLSYSKHNTRCKEYFVSLKSQNACLTQLVKMQQLITNFNLLWLINVGGAKLIDVHSIGWSQYFSMFFVGINSENNLKIVNDEQTKDIFLKIV